MWCRQCGHDNPESNRYCGMCGSGLASERPTDQPPPPSPAKPAARAPKPAAPEPVKLSDQRLPKNDEITIGGPSFLGLSRTPPGKGDYSYLFEDEDEPSHVARWLLVALLLVLSGVVYARWQPLRDFALTTAIPYVQALRPAAANSAAAPPPEAKAAPAVDTPAPAPPAPSSDIPPASTEPSANQQQPAEQASGAPKEGLRGKQPESADSGNVEPKATVEQAARQQDAVKEEAPAEQAKPAAKRSVAAPASEGSDLVSSGEKYLYGRGAAQNCGQAVSYFHAAAAKENAQAFSHLGALYATGHCVPRDRALAYTWFRRAYVKEPGNHYFEKNLTMLWREMTPAERQRATGRQ